MKMKELIVNRTAISIGVLSLLLTGLSSVPASSEISGDISIVPVRDGSSVTIYEQTGNIYPHTYAVLALLGTEEEFFTTGNERYTISSDGTYIRIHCYSPENREKGNVGSNIVAVRLDGVSGFPDGIWASFVKELTLGYNGIEESAMNALGPKDRLGPYSDSYCTYLGDQHSEIVVGFGNDTSVEEDSDGDGWPDEQERRAGTNPHNVDTDRDGIWDPRDPNPLRAEETESSLGFGLVILGFALWLLVMKQR